MKPIDRLGFNPTHVVEKVEDGYLIHITPPAFIGGDTVTVYLTEAHYRGYERWLEGDLIQNALPNLTKQEREMLMTGLSYTTQARVFK